MSAALKRRFNFVTIPVVSDLTQEVVGVALDPWDDDRFGTHTSDAIHQAIDDVDPDVEKRLLGRLSYVSGDYTDTGTFERLGTAVSSHGGCLHYLAIPPAMFETVIGGLGDAGLLDRSRILVEKPFGRDRRTAGELNQVLHQRLSEQSIYRIDHFLGKEAVENLLSFRYANPIFDAVWSRHHIDHIELTMAESFGVEDRGALYDGIGVIRDVVQNHLLQVVCLLTMEAPVSPDADAFADERVKVLRAMQTPTEEDVVFGQYQGYLDVPHVKGDSNTATFAAVALRIDNPRWYGVPIFIRTGKALATTATQATVVFRDSPPLSFSPDESLPTPNQLVFRIGPSDGVDLLVQTKDPGDGLRLVTTPLSVDYESIFGRIPLAYERVLHDALEANHSQFGREDAVEEAWRIVDDICDPSTRPAAYPTGGWGPASAADLLGPGRTWVEPHVDTV